MARKIALGKKFKFQFLIGTIKTELQYHLARMESRVSIPYRYDKNFHIIPFCCLNLRVSIPYRYDKNSHSGKLTPTLYSILKTPINPVESKKISTKPESMGPRHLNY
ncbi:MAG: hypothetical protein HPY74_06975 [Firmicutes bacterium]|nr:hypothetical protein [Bacillota bacterium]